MLAKKVVFGQHLHGPFPRLYSKLIDYPTGSYLYIWKTFLQHADNELLEDILVALKNGSERRNLIMLSAICGGHDGMGRPIGKNKKLKRTARRFTYHVIDTVDMFCFLSGVSDLPIGNDSLRQHLGLMGYMRGSYSWLTPPSKARPDGRLNDRERALANAFIVTRGTGRSGAMESGIYLLADHFDEMKPYFKTIHSYPETTVDHLRALLATKPELALAAGAL